MYRVRVRVTIGLGLRLGLVLHQVLGDRNPCTRTHPYPRTPTRSHAPTHTLTHMHLTHALTPTPRPFPAPLTHAMPPHPRAGLGRSGSSVMRWFRWAESALRDAAGMHTADALRGGGVRIMAYDQRYAQSEVRAGDDIWTPPPPPSPEPNLNAHSNPGQDEVQLRGERHRLARLAQRQR